MDGEGKPVKPPITVNPEEPDEPEPPGGPIIDEGPDGHRKYYFDGGHVDVAAHVVYELDPDGRQLRVVKFTDYTAERVRTLYRNAADLRRDWSEPKARGTIIENLADRGVDFDELARAADTPDADPFDLLCHVAFNAPLRTRRERAQRLPSEKKDFFDQFGPDARAVLNDLLDKYAEHGVAQFLLPDILEAPPISQHGNLMEIATWHLCRPQAPCFWWTTRGMREVPTRG